MRLVNHEYDIDCFLKENTVTVFHLENPQLYSYFINHLWNQSRGELGEFTLTHNEKEVLFKNIELIFNPYQLDFKNKKIINALYKELETICINEYPVKENILNSEIIEFLNELSQKVDYPIDMNLDLDIKGLLKLYDVKLDIESTDLLDLLVEYIQMMHRICRTEVFCFVNLKLYLNDNQLHKFYKMCFYEKVYIILIEGIFTHQLKYEKNYIFDQDYCKIEL